MLETEDGFVSDSIGLPTEIHAHQTSRAGLEPRDQEEASIRDPFLSDKEKGGHVHLEQFEQD